ncbi:MAG: hypothetical protein PF518_09155 [Spirochaetaceae bacterium]|jgi:hypothetical protein|nr:hypothetical protein [Spirochaetaceae bacterium]
MNKVFKLLTLLLAVFLLSSCLSSGIEIIVNKDGSGKIIQTFQVQQEYMAFMNLGDEVIDPNMINQQELVDRATQMGEGVRFEKVEPVKPGSSYAGYTATYSFTDISKVKTTATPMTSPVEMEEDESDWITFDFKKGGTSILTIMSSSNDDIDGEYDGEEYESDETPDADEGMKEQMKQIYKSMHFWFKVKVNGDISKTNALYSSPSEVIIMDMNFENIVEDDDLFSYITSDNSSDLKSVRDQLEKIGVKIDDQEKIEISFR